MERNTCLIALSFGAGKKHGLSNYDIADKVTGLALSKNLPIIAQWEVYEVIEKAFPDVRNRLTMFRIDAENGKYLDTHKVLLKAQEIMHHEDYTKAVLLGHQAHLPRIRLAAKKLGIQENKKIDPGFIEIEYDMFSTQWWTRGPIRFWFREIPTYAYYWLKGWI